MAERLFIYGEGGGGGGGGIYSVLYDFFCESAVILSRFLKFQTVFARFICDEILRFGEIYKSHLNLHSRLNL